MRRVFAGCGLLLVFAACSEAHELETTNRLQTNDAAPTAAAESGSGAPAVSNVMATQQMQTLQRNLSRSSAGLHAEALSGGVRKVDLQGRFLHATVLEHRTDGTQRRVCVDHPSAMSEMF
jgi:hypothetical protein